MQTLDIFVWILKRNTGFTLSTSHEYHPQMVVGLHATGGRRIILNWRKTNTVVYDHAHICRGYTCYFAYNRARLCRGVNPGGLGVATPQILGRGSWGSHGGSHWWGGVVRIVDGS